VPNAGKARDILTTDETPKPAKDAVNAETKSVKKPVKNEVVKQKSQPTFKISRKEVKAANKEATKNTEKALNQLGIDRVSSKGATAPVTSAELPFAGDFMDTLHSIGGAAGLTGLGTLRLNTTKGMRQALDKYVDMYGFSKRLTILLKSGLVKFMQG
jgi:hypothetical protein